METEITPTISGCGKGKGMTNYERIKSMSVEEVAHVLLRWEDLRMPYYCQNLPECDADLENDVLIPEDRCAICVKKWLMEEEK